MSKVVVLRREDGDEEWGYYLDTVLNCVKDVMDDLFQKTARKDVLVKYSDNGPMLVLEKDTIKTEPYTILMSAKGLHWCQFIYQFAHEYCHILIGTEKTYFPCADGKYHFMWLEEALCELASLEVFRHVAETKGATLFNNDYQNKMYENLNKKVDRLQKDTDFKKWFTNSYETLTTDYKIQYKLSSEVSDDDNVRKRGEVVLSALLPYTQDPKFWVLIGKLEEIQPFLGSDKIGEFLQALFEVVKEDPALVRCLKNIQDTFSTT